MVKLALILSVFAACTDGIGTVTQENVVIDGGLLQADEINVVKSVTDYTVSYSPAIKGVVNGTFDTTASGLNAIGVFGECAATRGSGSNTLICSGVYGYSNGGAPDNRAVRGVMNSYTSNSENYAGVFSNTSTASGSVNWGVLGAAVGSGSYVNYGGYFTAGGASVNWALYVTNAKTALGVNGYDTIAFGDVRLGSETGPLLRADDGSPEGSVTAPVGSMYLRTDGGSGSTFYVKESGTGNTGWVAK